MNINIPTSTITILLPCINFTLFKIPPKIPVTFKGAKLIIAWFYKNLKHQFKRLLRFYTYFRNNFYKYSSINKNNMKIKLLLVFCLSALFAQSQSNNASAFVKDNY